MAQELNSNTLVYFPKSDIDNIANSIRGVSGESGRMTVENMPGIINNLSSASPNSIVITGNNYEVGSGVEAVDGLLLSVHDDEYTVHFNNTRLLSAGNFMSNFSNCNFIITGDLDLSGLVPSWSEYYVWYQMGSYDRDNKYTVDFRLNNFARLDYENILNTTEYTGFQAFTCMSNSVRLVNYFNNGDVIRQSGDIYGKYENLFSGLEISESLICILDNVTYHNGNSSYRFLYDNLSNSVFEARGTIDCDPSVYYPPQFDKSVFKEVFWNNTVIKNGIIQALGKYAPYIHGSVLFSDERNTSMIDDYGQVEIADTKNKYLNAGDVFSTKIDVDIDISNWYTKRQSPLFSILCSNYSSSASQNVIAWINLRSDNINHNSFFYTYGLFTTMVNSYITLYLNFNGSGVSNIAQGRIFRSTTTPNELTVVVDRNSYDLLRAMDMWDLFGRSMVVTDESYEGRIEFNLGNYSKFVNVDKRFYNTQYNFNVYCESD